MKIQIKSQIPTLSTGKTVYYGTLKWHSCDGFTLLSPSLQQSIYFHCSGAGDISRRLVFPIGFLSFLQKELSIWKSRGRSLKMQWYPSVDDEKEGSSLVLDWFLALSGVFFLCGIGIRSPQEERVTLTLVVWGDTSFSGAVTVEAQLETNGDDPVLSPIHGNQLFWTMMCCFEKSNWLPNFR